MPDSPDFPSVPVLPVVTRGGAGGGAGGGASADGSPVAMPAPGSQAALRRANQDRVTALLAGGAVLSQAELARRSGLSGATLSGIVARLETDGLVERTTGAANGRRAQLVRLRAGRGVAVGVDVGRTHVRLAVGRRDGSVVAEETSPLEAGHDPVATLATVRRRLLDLLDQHDLDPADLAGVGVGMPGPLDRRLDAVTGGTILPGWVGVRVPAAVAEALSGVYDGPVVVENDANLGAVASAAVGGVALGRGAQGGGALSGGTSGGVESGDAGGDVVYLKVGSGIGAGIVLGGRLRVGSTGLAGEIGHFTVNDGGAICRCGKRGCLETVASADAVRLALAAILDRPVTDAEIVALSERGDPVVHRVVQEAGEAIGRALGTVCTFLDPGRVVIGGQLAFFGDRLLDPVRAGFARSTLPPIAAATEISISTLGERAEALGALRLALGVAGVRG